MHFFGERLGLTAQSHLLVIAVAGEEVYYGLLEIWAEFLSHFSQGTLTHCGFIARKL
jgi:hypothetical protein